MILTSISISSWKNSVFCGSDDPGPSLISFLIEK